MMNNSLNINSLTLIIPTYIVIASLPECKVYFYNIFRHCAKKTNMKKVML